MSEDMTEREIALRRLPPRPAAARPEDWRARLADLDVAQQRVVNLEQQLGVARMELDAVRRVALLAVAAHAHMPQSDLLAYLYWGYQGIPVEELQVAFRLPDLRDVARLAGVFTVHWQCEYCDHTVEARLASREAMRVNPRPRCRECGHRWGVLERAWMEGAMRAEYEARWRADGLLAAPALRSGGRTAAATPDQEPEA